MRCCDSSLAVASTHGEGLTSLQAVCGAPITSSLNFLVCPYLQGTSELHSNSGAISLEQVKDVTSHYDICSAFSAQAPAFLLTRALSSTCWPGRQTGAGPVPPYARAASPPWLALRADSLKLHHWHLDGVEVAAPRVTRPHRAGTGPRGGRAQPLLPRQPRHLTLNEAKS